MNKIEEYKKAKDGLDIVDDVPRFAAEGWQAISDGDKERLKWAGVFFRRQTPGRFMMRVRIPNGIGTASQLRVLAGIAQDFGRGFADLTTRQQVQLRWFTIGDVPEIWTRLESVGLVSLQTGMDNIRNVVGCPAAGLTPNELLDASPVVRKFTAQFLGNRAYTNLPRKFNATITGCKDNCTHAETQDLALTPASRDAGESSVNGFNVAVGGKMGSGGYRAATPLDLFVEPDEAAKLAGLVVEIFRDHGLRELRTKARLAFLVDDWGPGKFRDELERRFGRRLPAAGRDARTERHTDHVGIYRQKQPGLNYVGLCVPVGRLTGEQMLELAEVAESYGSGLVRFTAGQNVILPNVPDALIGAITAEPLLRTLRYDPSEIMRGTVSCTGAEFCHFALIDTKRHALRVAQTLEQTVGKTKPIGIHWSGCPASCANQAAADIGLIGKNVKVDGRIEEAVDIYVGGATGRSANPPIKIMEDVRCGELPAVLGWLVRHGAFRAMRQQLRKLTPPPRDAAPAAEKAAPPPVIVRIGEIPEGRAKLFRCRGEEIAVFNHDGQPCALQNLCPHEGGPLSRGRIVDGWAVCPLHGYRFDLRTGACADDPKLKARVFPLSNEDGPIVLKEIE